MEAFLISSVAHGDLLTRTASLGGPGSGSSTIGGGGGGAGGNAGSGAAGGSAGAAIPDDGFADDLIKWAGQATQTALPELLQSAVRQAPALQSARIDIKIAQAQITQTEARSDWRFTLQGSGSHGTDYSTGVPIASDIYGGSADLSRVLPTGATFDLHASSAYNKVVETGFPNATFWVDNLSASIAQPLLRGAGPSYYNARERRAEQTRDVAVLARRLAAIQTVQAVVATYWDLVLAQRQIAITEQSLALARERLRVTAIGVKVGKVADAEIPAVQQIIATREEDVLNGQLGVLVASVALRRAAGMTIDAGALGLRVEAEIEMHAKDLVVGELVKRAFEASPELGELAKQDKGATIDIEVNDNGLLPQLDAAIAVGPIDSSSSPSTAAKDTASGKSLAVLGSLTFSQSIGRHGVIGRSHELRAGREKIRVSEFDVRAQIAQAMARAVSQYELAKRRVVLSRRAIELAKGNIQIETNRFNAGTRTNFDVLNRLEDLRQAELREAQALVDWHKADNIVMALTGDILPTFGITVE